MSPQNRGETGPRIRDASGRFRQGVSGNPGGRPKGFVGRIQAATGGADYKKLVQAFAIIAFGNAAQREKFFKEPVTVNTRDRLEALTALRDSGPGRPIQTSETDPAAVVPAFCLPEGTRGVSVR